MRNPWRFSFDRLTGDLWIADVGQSAYEEIDFVLAGAGGGLNSAGVVMKVCILTTPAVVIRFTLIPWLSSAIPMVIARFTGGFVYRGVAYPALQGRYLFTDFCNTAIRSITRTGSGPARFDSSCCRQCIFAFSVWRGCQWRALCGQPPGADLQNQRNSDFSSGFEQLSALSED